MFFWIFYNNMLERKNIIKHIIRKIWRYQRGNQNPYSEEEHTMATRTWTNEHSLPRTEEREWTTYLEHFIPNQNRQQKLRIFGEYTISTDK